MRGSGARSWVSAFVAAAVVGGLAPSALGQTAPLPATLTVQLSEVRLFEEAVVSGRLDPPHPGVAVQLTLFRDDRTVEQRSIPVASDGSTFETEFPIEDWGRYRAQATFAGDADHAPATASTEPKKVGTPRPINTGANGDLVLGP